MVEKIEQMVSWQDQADYAFMQRVVKEVTKSCALPFSLPLDRIPDYIVQAAQMWWDDSDLACKEKLYAIPNSEICKCDKLNKTIKLPPQILTIHGCYKIQQGLKYGVMGDFSIERMMMSSYSQFAGIGTVGGGFSSTAGTGYNLVDVISAMYEIDTFNQTLNPPLTYDYNTMDHELNLEGALGGSDLLIQCFVRCKIQDMYNNYRFFRTVVCFVKQNLSEIIGTYDFKLPGGITINYDKISDRADSELEKIEEWIQNHNSPCYFFQPNTL